jgi:hypothetical protein
MTRYGRRAATEQSGVDHALDAIVLRVHQDLLSVGNRTGVILLRKV